MPEVVFTNARRSSTMLPILRKLRPARRQLHRAPRIYKPQLEILEDRRLLSGFTDLFVVNSDSNSIARFDASGTPTFVTASGGGPAFIIFDSDGDFLVSSPALGTVHEYSPTG